MFQQGRFVIVWLTWLVGGVFGVTILLVIICYCRQMPRHQKSLDEKYMKEYATIKESHTYSSIHTQDSYKVKHEVAGSRQSRPASYGGEWSRSRTSHCHVQSLLHHQSEDSRTHPYNEHYASSSMLDDIESAAALDALKTRSLPAFLRPKQKPLSTEDDLNQLYAKVNLSKKHKNRMRSEHAAIIAMSKSQSQYLDADAVIVYDQRTVL